MLLHSQYPVECPFHLLEGCRRMVCHQILEEVSLHPHSKGGQVQGRGRALDHRLVEDSKGIRDSDKRGSLRSMRMQKVHGSRCTRCWTSVCISGVGCIRSQQRQPGRYQYAELSSNGGSITFDMRSGQKTRCLLQDTSIPLKRTNVTI